MKNRIVKVMMISVTMMMMVTGCKGTTKNSDNTAKSNDVQSIETSVELPQNMPDDFQTEIYYIVSQEESDKCYEALQYRDGKIVVEVVTGNLVGICWNCMRSEMKTHFKMETAKKRQPAEIIMTKVSSAEDEVIALEILKSVMENLTIRQQNIITLKMLGYSNTEICLMMEISKSSYYRELENIRQMLVDGKF